MNIDPSLWAKLHGASTHFPLALAAVSAFCDLLGLIWKEPLRKQQLQGAGFCTMVLAAAGTFPAVLSGLFLSRGEMWGHGALLFHHLFVWPSFAFLVGLGVWRFLMEGRVSVFGFRLYLGLVILTAILMAGAGYWGGELVLSLS